VVCTSFLAICPENNNHRMAKRLCGAPRRCAHVVFCVNHRKTGIHQKRVYSNEPAALEGPIFGAGVYILAPNATMAGSNNLETMICHSYGIFRYRYASASHNRTDLKVSLRKSISPSDEFSTAVPNTLKASGKQTRCLSIYIVPAAPPISMLT
jgi:hypothetical protein